jgi:monofunctional glycosyltransferase
VAVKKKTSGKTRKRRGKKKPGFFRVQLSRAVKIAARVFWGVLGIQAFVVFLFGIVNPPTNFYMLSESRRLDGIKQEWMALEDVAPDMARAVVAAEDANFCGHWGFDLGAIRRVVTSGTGQLRGASTLTQQVAKNVFLWPDRSWVRKLFEAETTLMIELFWTKRRIVEVYINVAEFDEGVFGVGAAGPHYFGVKAGDLSLRQTARLAAILPNPKGRSASNPSGKTLKRAAAIVQGAQTIKADGRDDCFSG